MDREERQMYVGCGQVVGLLLSPVLGVGLGVYLDYSGREDQVGTGLLVGLVAGPLLGYTIAMGANVVDRIRYNDWDDVKERMAIRKRWRNSRSIDDNL